MARRGEGAADSVRIQLLALDPADYVPHDLHAVGRAWRETNCAADLWIELLHALGHDPVAGLAFTLGTDFDGDQWRMFTFPPEDLRSLYGIEVDELNIWRPTSEHLAEQVGFGRPVAIDADAFFLPDTRGTTYRTVHHKTTVLVQMIDLDEPRLGYFHNAGYFELAGDDFHGLLGTGRGYGDPMLPPFAQFVRLERTRTAPPDVEEVALLARRHHARRSVANPISRLRKRIEEDLDWLSSQDLETFHLYSFGTLRQCGSNAALAAEFTRWLDERCDAGLAPATDAFARVADGMEAAQFALARAARKGTGSLGPLFAAMERDWESATEHLDERLPA